jgi:hypothetical protein
MREFIASQPMASLSPLNKMEVIDQVYVLYKRDVAAWIKKLDIQRRSGNGESRKDIHSAGMCIQLKNVLCLNSKNIYKIVTAVDELKIVCDLLLSKAQSAQTDLSDIEGKRIADNIPNAMEAFLKSDAMYSLWPQYKSNVFDQAYELYDITYQELRKKKRKSVWDVYVERAYKVLTITLRENSEKMKIDNKS